MRRQEIWEAVADASDTMHAAFDAYRRECSVQSRRRVDLTVQRFIETLDPLIGEPAAVAYETALVEYQEVIGRLARLKASMAGRMLEDRDVADQRQVQADQTEAEAAISRADTELGAAIERAAALEYP